MEKNFQDQSCRGTSNGDLGHDLEVNDQGHLKVKSIFSNGNPVTFWPRKWKEQKILRSGMSLSQGHRHGHGHGHV